VLAFQTDHGFGRVLLSFVNKLVTGWRTERMIDTGIEVRKRADNVFLRQTGRNRHWHGEILLSLRPPHQ
jgi:hypothetical protein